MAAPDLDAFAASQAEIEELRRSVGDLQRRLLRSKARTADLVEATLEGARLAMVALGGVPVVAPPKPTSGKARQRPAEVALWHLTDWQGAKVTPSYNSAVMRKRVLRFVDKAAQITEVQRQDHPVDECVIALGGDMCEGLFNFPHQVFEVDQTIFGQFVSVARLIVDATVLALALYRTVTVVAEWGNHGRIGSRRAVVPPSDNFDRMIYELARQMLGPQPRLTWHDSSTDIQHIEVGNYRALLIHGDEIGRNGFASRNTIVQAVNRWRSGAHRLNGKPWAFRDVYVGHYHTHAEDPMANGEGAIYWTGSTESDNRYAADSLASSALASQRLHFINPVSGHVTAQYKVRLEED